MYNALPQEYRVATNDELKERIILAKRQHGSALCILCHHYQRVDLIPFADHIGDSYGLSKIAAAQKDVQYIVFCGVHFMAESADILTDPKKKVFLPNPLAGCPMADMADMADVLAAWDQLQELGGAKTIMPISYMNTTAGLKAFTGKNGGVICTSSNATAALTYALERREKVFFFPDENLGWNTGLKFGLSPDEMVIWDFSKRNGGVPVEHLRHARIILWKGHCHVHTNFTADHVRSVRAEHPGIRIVVHPECRPDVVSLADANGSTSFIVDYCKKAPSGSTIAIGTEINLINRMALEHPDKTIFELSGQTCPVCANMFRTTLNDLAYTLENLDTMKPVSVPEPMCSDALLALEKMLEIQ